MLLPQIRDQSTLKRRTRTCPNSRYAGRNKKAHRFIQRWEGGLTIRMPRLRAQTTIRSFSAIDYSTSTLALERSFLSRLVRNCSVFCCCICFSRASFTSSKFFTRAGVWAFSRMTL